MCGSCGHPPMPLENGAALVAASAEPVMSDPLHAPFDVHARREVVDAPGLVVTSTVVRTPVRKSDCVVSVRQALGGAAASEKFCVVVPPSVTTMPEAEPGTNPGLLAVIDG